MVPNYYLNTRESRVLDLFCGTGALGFEALSRGAEHVCFVDIKKTALNIVNKNLTLLGVEKETTLLQRDVTKLYQNPELDYDLIFLDPPYNFVGRPYLSVSFLELYILSLFKILLPTEFVV